MKSGQTENGMRKIEVWLNDKLFEWIDEPAQAVPESAKMVSPRARVRQYIELYADWRFDEGDVLRFESEGCKSIQHVVSPLTDAGRAKGAAMVEAEVRRAMGVVRGRRERAESLAHLESFQRAFKMAPLSEYGPVIESQGGEER